MDLKGNIINVQKTFTIPINPQYVKVEIGLSKSYITYQKDSSFSDWRLQLSFRIGLLVNIKIFLLGQLRCPETKRVVS